MSALRPPVLICCFAALLFAALRRSHEVRTPHLLPPLAPRPGAPPPPSPARADHPPALPRTPVAHRPRPHLEPLLPGVPRGTRAGGAARRAPLGRGSVERHAGQ